MTASYKNLQKSDSPPRLGGSNGNSLQAGRPGCSRPDSCLRSVTRWEKNRPKQRDPAEKDQPACVGMSDEHVLQVRRSGVRVITDEDDDYHSENIRRIGSQESEPEEDPHPFGRSLILCEDKGREG